MQQRNRACRRRRSALPQPGRCSGYLSGQGGVILMLAAPLGKEHLPLDQAEMVKEKYAIEMIDLVLYGARHEAGGFLAKQGAVGVERLDDDSFGPADIRVNLGNGEAAFFRHCP